MRKALFVLLLSLPTVLLTGLWAGVSLAEGVGRIPTVTRLVLLFSDLEERLSTAVQRRNMSAVSELLTEDFEMRVGSMPGNPIPRAEWIKQSFAEPEPAPVAEQMAVHGFGDIAIASFLQKATSSTSKTIHKVFIVDVWRQQAGHWKLAVRYAAPAAQDNQHVSGAPLSPPVFEKKE